jgi:hypothetical protein
MNGIGSVFQKDQVKDNLINVKKQWAERSKLLSTARDVFTYISLAMVQG